VVAGVAYIEHVRRLPSAFSATLQVEPDNRYFRHAIAVVAAGEKVGYIAPEGARSRYESIKAACATGAPTCRVRRAGADRTAQGAIELYLDLSAFPLAD